MKAAEAARAAVDTKVHGVLGLSISAGPGQVIYTIRQEGCGIALQAAPTPASPAASQAVTVVPGTCLRYQVIQGVGQPLTPPPAPTGPNQANDGPPPPPQPECVLPPPMPVPPPFVAKMMARRMKHEQVKDLMKLYYFCCHQGLYEEAEQIAHQAHAIEPRNVAVEAAVRLAHKLASMARGNTRIECPQKVEAPSQMPASVCTDEGCKKKTVSELMNLCRYYSKVGQYNTAVMYAEKALELDPGNEEVCVALKDVQVRQAYGVPPTGRPGGCAATFTRDLDKGCCTDSYVGPACFTAADPDSAVACPGKEHEIQRRLMEPVSLHFQDVRLDHIIDQLRSMTGLNICIDVPALNKAGVRLEMPLSLKVDNLSLRSALDLLLKQAHLTHVIQDEVVMVKPEQDARGKKACRVYPMVDLVRPHGIDRVETLVQMIQQEIAPQTWSCAGGLGTITYLPLGQVIVVEQTPDVQEQVEDLLAALRRMMATNK
jgi:tetratricopeptide (TPR) repeat protein